MREAITDDHRPQELAQHSQYQRNVSSRLLAGGACRAGVPVNLIAVPGIIAAPALLLQRSQARHDWGSTWFQRWGSGFAFEFLANLIIATSDYW